MSVPVGPELSPEVSLPSVELVSRESPAISEKVTHMTIVTPSPSVFEQPVRCSDVLSAPQIIYFKGANGTTHGVRVGNSGNTVANRTLAPKPPGLKLHYHTNLNATKKIILTAAGPIKTKSPNPSSLLQSEQQPPVIDKGIVSTLALGSRPKIDNVEVSKDQEIMNECKLQLKQPTVFKSAVIHPLPKSSSTPPPTSILLNKIKPSLVKSTLLNTTTSAAIPTTMASSLAAAMSIPRGKILLPRSTMPTQVGGQAGGMISLKITNGQIFGQSTASGKLGGLTEPTPLVLPVDPPTDAMLDQIVMNKPRKPNIIKSSKSYKQPESLFPNATFTTESGIEKGADVTETKTNQEPQQSQDLSRCLQEAVDSLFSANRPTVARKFDTVEATLIPDAPVTSNATGKAIKDTTASDKKELEEDLKTPPSSPSVIKNITKALDWSPEGVGALPESNIKFCVNEFGLVELMDEDKKNKGKKNKNSEGDVSSASTPDSSERSAKKPRLMKKSLIVKSKDMKTAQKKNDEICCCKGCGCYGLASEYPSPEFCSDSCKKEFDYNELHRKENESLELLLKEKRRQARIEQIMKQKILKQTARIAERNLQRTLKKVTLTSIVKSVEERTPTIESADKDSGNTVSLDLPIDEDEHSLDPTWTKMEDSDISMTPSESEEDAASSIGSSLDAGTADAGSADVGTTEAEPADSGTSDAKPRLPWQKYKAGFSWIPYLTHNRAHGAPLKLFKDQFQITKNGFKVGMRMEGIDPEHASLFCVLSVADVVGFRMKLHFDGFSDKHDFWVNADSQDIFPCGWCERNNRILQPPFGFEPSTFNIITYLKQCKALYAPRNLFYNKIRHNITPNGFRLGMKLEAVDQQNTSLVCVATVADILDNRILVHFDGWDDIYNYWADPTSSYIHPVGWCKSQNHVLSPPNNYQGDKFTWEEYLKETKSQAAPIRAFKPRQTGGFRPGMKLESVDRRMPAVVRVATVDDVREHQIRIKFDGWSDIYSYWVDEDSRDIHPMSWCQKVGHHLEPPLLMEDPNAECPTPDCLGQGHVDGSKHMVKHSVVGCPYDPQNLILPVEEEDRLAGTQYQATDHPIVEPEKKPPSSRRHPDERKRPEDKKRLEEKKKEKPVEEKNAPVEKNKPGRPPKWRTLLPQKPKNRGRPPKWRREDSRESSLDQEWTQETERKQAKRQQKKLLKQKALSKRNTEFDQVRQELQQAVMNPGYEANAEANTPFLWEKHSHALNAHVDAVADTDMTGWSFEQVVKFVASVPGCEPFTDVFATNLIDGEALSMISQQDLVKYLGIKLGPAIKLYNSVVMLRQIEKSSSL